MKRRKTIEEFKSELFLINKNIEVIGNYVNAHTPIKCVCLIDGNIFEKTPQSLLKGCMCSVCSNRKVLKGVNDIGTTHPHLLKYLVNIEDGYRLHLNKTEKVKVKCPYCGEEKESVMLNLHRYGVSCPKCGDKISYPNKFVRNIFEQLGVIQQNEVVFDWCEKDKRRIYDIYLPDHNTIIEVHGKFHYEECNFMSNEFKSVKENDIYKKEIALKNGIKNYIEIDCSESTLNYIKNSIITSSLKDTFCLDKIDWKKCHESALNNTTKDICDAYNGGMKHTLDLSNKFNMSREAVIRYLKKGQIIGWCDYNSREALRINGTKNSKKGLSKKIYCVEYDMQFNSLSDCCKYLSETYGINATQGGISSIKRGKNKTHCGLHFEYV